MPLAPLRVVRPTAERPPASPASPLARWGATVAAAEDGVLLLDTASRVVSVSPSGAALLGSSPAELIGRPLLDAVTFIDFEVGERDPGYASRVPPLLALRSASLARGIVRVDRPAGRVTLDLVSAVLRGSDGKAAGVISFLAPVTSD